MLPKQDKPALSVSSHEVTAPDPQTKLSNNDFCL